jgi:hypothetical protein
MRALGAHITALSFIRAAGSARTGQIGDKPNRLAMRAGMGAPRIELGKDPR